MSGHRVGEFVRVGLPRGRRRRRVGGQRRCGLGRRVGAVSVFVNVGVGVSVGTQGRRSRRRPCRGARRGQCRRIGCRRDALAGGGGCPCNACGRRPRIGGGSWGVAVRVGVAVAVDAGGGVSVGDEVSVAVGVGGSMWQPASHPSPLIRLPSSQLFVVRFDDAVATGTGRHSKRSASASRAPDDVVLRTRSVLWPRTLRPVLVTLEGHEQCSPDRCTAPESCSSTRRKTTTPLRMHGESQAPGAPARGSFQRAPVQPIRRIRAPDGRVSDLERRDIERCTLRHARVRMVDTQAIWNAQLCSPPRSRCRNSGHLRNRRSGFFGTPLAPMGGTGLTSHSAAHSVPRGPPPGMQGFVGVGPVHGTLSVDAHSRGGCHRQPD